MLAGLAPSLVTVGAVKLVQVLSLQVSPVDIMRVALGTPQIG